MERAAESSVKFHDARRRHPGMESAISDLHSGNELPRCRMELKMALYAMLFLAVLGRNLHALGKLLLSCEDELALAAQSKRDAA